MTNRTDENQKGEYAPVNAVFSVWGSDENSVLDHGVGGLDPAQQDQKNRSRSSATCERLALITISKTLSVETSTAKSVLMKIERFNGKGGVT